jgi:hypothetical protein
LLKINTITQSFFVERESKLFYFCSFKGNLTQTKMKKVLTLTLVGFAVALVMASCKSSSGGHCDAYGSLDQTTKSDVASK